MIYVRMTSIERSENCLGCHHHNPQNIDVIDDGVIRKEELLNCLLSIAAYSSLLIFFFDCGLSF
jgi:hypothetical protein